MTALERKLKLALRKMGVSLSDTLVVGVSGGADSTALLHALARWRELFSSLPRVIAAHLNHQLRGAEADADEEFVRQLAQRLNLPCVTERMDVAAAAKGKNLEATARRLRYEFLQRVAYNKFASTICTAHTLDDQAETVLLRLLRGAGTKGLQGIHPMLALPDKRRVLRPLLQVTRAEVEAHCAHYQLAYRTDSTNVSPALARNRVRHEVLPLLRSFNPQIAQVLARTAALAAEDEAALAALETQALQEALCADDSLDLKVLRKLPATLQRRVMQAWIHRHEALPLAAGHLAALAALANVYQSGRTIELPHDWRVRREFDRLRLWRKPVPPRLPMERTRLPVNEPVVFHAYELTLHPPMTRQAAEEILQANPPAFSCLLAPRLAGQTLWLRTRQWGDAYQIGSHSGPTKLKNQMHHLKMPLSQRDTLPLLVTEQDEILWGPGLAVARTYELNPAHEMCILVIAREQCNLPGITSVMPGVTQG
jgi:tRNA(Ile)-lysidine synthase